MRRWKVRSGMMTTLSWSGAEGGRALDVQHADDLAGDHCRRAADWPIGIARAEEQLAHGLADRRRHVAPPRCSASVKMRPSDDVPVCAR